MPKTFKDLDGREWSIRINIGAMRRAKARDIDLSMPVPQLRSFMLDDVFLTDALWSIIELQAKERQVTVDQFESSIDGRVLAEARERLWESLVEFYDPPKAEMLGMALTAIREEIDKATQSIGSIGSASSKGNSATDSTTTPSEKHTSPSEPDDQHSGITQQV